MNTNRSNAGALIGGALLIAFGLLSLAGQIFRWMDWGLLWPFIIIGVGGAFFAGMVLKRAEASDAASLEHKLDAVGYGFFIPVFFVSSGMALDVGSIVDAPSRLFAFFGLLLLVRGVPAFLLYGRDLSAVRRLQLALLTATALPLLVGLAEVGLESGIMLPENAAALVGAGVLSVACSRRWQCCSNPVPAGPRRRADRSEARRLAGKEDCRRSARRAGGRGW